MFELVAKFQEEVLKNVVTEKGLMNPEQLKLVAAQLHEEVDELVEAHETQDYIGAIDAAIDSIYFGIGALHIMGLKPNEMVACFEAVNNCNMMKRRGIVERRGDGSAADAVKPEGWVGPEERIANILENFNARQVAETFGCPA